MRTIALAFAVVNIEDSPAALIAIAVFLATFALMGFLAYRLLAGPLRARRDAHGGVTFDLSARLPVSKATFDRLAAATEAGLKAPERTPELDAYVHGLKQTRRTLLGISRTIAIAGGLVLLFIAAALYRDATPANMLLLPAGILALLGAGALLKGLVPEHRMEPIDPTLLEKIRVTTSSTAPLTVRLDRLDLMKAAELRRSGASWDEVARAVHPGYEDLSPFERGAVQQAIEQALAAADR